MITTPRPPASNVAPVRSFEAQFLRAVDGDTLKVSVDLGFRVRVGLTVRLRGVNCPELKTPEGVAAKNFVDSKMGVGDSLLLTTHGFDKYGRSVSYVLFGGVSPSTGTDLGEALVEAGHAVNVKPSLER